MGEVGELQKFDVKNTLCCNLLITQEKFCGWEAGIRTPDNVVQRGRKRHR
jgi:hypothetical protein